MIAYCEIIILLNAFVVTGMNIKQIGHFTF